MEHLLEFLSAEADRTSPTMVAATLGVSENTVRRWLSRDRNPSVGAMLRALRAYPTLEKTVFPKGITVRDLETLSKKRSAA